VSKAIHIGQILVEQGVLNEQQVFEILEAQRKKGVPFGVLAERMFEVTIESIERAWAQQYHRYTGTIDLATQTPDKKALGLINRRQAWQFEMMPIGFEPTGEVVIAASRQRLARAVTFVTNKLEPVAYFRIADPAQLREYLKKHYAMPEVSPDLIDRAKSLVWPPTAHPSGQ